MQVARFPEGPHPKWSAPVVALGNFDGVHRGHQRLIDQVRVRASERAGTPVALVFEPHPGRVLRPDKAPPLLMTFDQKLAAFERAGLRGAAVVRFTPEMSRWEPEAFVERVLITWLRAAEVWVGENFLFGRDRAGTFTLLRALGEDRGFRVEKIEPVRYKSFVVSSTRVRHLLAEGRVDEAGALLGHHYSIDGVVVAGDGRGRLLGCPTANLRTENALLPPDGVYATIASLDGVHHASVTSLGVRPTIGDGLPTIETHLLGQSVDLYGRSLRLAFVKWLRAQRRFETMEALAEQIATDCRSAREVLDRHAL